MLRCTSYNPIAFSEKFQLKRRKFGGEVRNHNKDNFGISQFLVDLYRKSPRTEGDLAEISEPEAVGRGRGDFSQIFPSVRGDFRANPLDNPHPTEGIPEIFGPNFIFLCKSV